MYAFILLIIVQSCTLSVPTEKMSENKHGSIVSLQYNLFAWLQAMLEHATLLHVCAWFSATNRIPVCFLFAKESSSSNKSISSSTCANTILKYKYKFKHSSQALRHKHLASRGKNSKSVLMRERVFGLRFAMS